MITHVATVAWRRHLKSNQVKLRGQVARKKKQIVGYFRNNFFPSNTSNAIICHHLLLLFEFSITVE